MLSTVLDVANHSVDTEVDRYIRETASVDTIGQWVDRYIRETASVDTIGQWVDRYSGGKDALVTVEIPGRKPGRNSTDAPIPRAPPGRGLQRL